MTHFYLILPFFICFYLSIEARMPSTYSDYYARHKIFPMVDFYSTIEFRNGTLNITEYINGCFNNSEWYGYVLKPCDMFNKKNLTCTGGVGVAHDEEAIIINFRGTVGGAELAEEEEFYNITATFPGGGTVANFWYNGFLIIWNGGIRDLYFTAKNKYPNYEVWVIGHSMGGSLAGNAAAYISQMGYADASLIKLMTFGQLRIGKADFISRFSSLVPYAYRVTHRADIVPHLIPTTAGYEHYAKEIWYPGYMNEGATYIECDTLESLNCSDSVPTSEYNWGDHVYFNSGLCLNFTRQG